MSFIKRNCLMLFMYVMVRIIRRIIRCVYVPAERPFWQLSVFASVKTRKPSDGFLWNIMLKSCTERSSHLNFLLLLSAQKLQLNQIFEISILWQYIYYRSLLDLCSLRFVSLTSIVLYSAPHYLLLGQVTELATAPFHLILSILLDEFL